MNAPAARFPLFVAVILSVLAPAAASAAGVPVLTRETKLVALEEQLFENRVGYSVAVDGNTAVVGSADASAAYVFQRIGGDWSLRQKLTAPDIIGYEYFGITVAINGDTIAVGAPFGNDFTGSAYVFVRTNGVWVQQQKLTASDPNIWDGFGGSFGLEGDTLAIGAPAASPGPTPGAVYVFLRSAGAWSLEQKLTPAGGAGGDVFGSAVALSGSTLVVGSPYDGHAGPYSGSAYVFQRAGSSFSQSQKLTANDAFERAAFGYSAAVAGNTAVLGSPGNVEGGGPGSAYVFVNEGGVWTQQQKLAASDGIGGNDFGFSVALSEKRLVVHEKRPVLERDSEARREPGPGDREFRLLGGDERRSRGFGRPVRLGGVLPDHRRRVRLRTGGDSSVSCPRVGGAEEQRRCRHPVRPQGAGSREWLTRRLRPPRRDLRRIERID
jgi:hypothetical protein